MNMRHLTSVLRQPSTLFVLTLQPVSLLVLMYRCREGGFFRYKTSVQDSTARNGRRYHRGIELRGSAR